MDLKIFHLAFLFACSVHFTAATSCSNDFYILESSLLQSSKNRFGLLKTFYPAREAHPVIVKAIYSFTARQEARELENATAAGNVSSRVWFWSESGFYLIQPLEVFQCTSLLFSNLLYRSGTVEIELPHNCSNSSQELLELLTVRVSELCDIELTTNYLVAGNSYLEL